jgi:broad specificity phosphatase PhoE
LPDAIVASPLGRVRATAALIAPTLGLEPSFDDDLRERCMGQFEGWTMDEIGAEHPQLRRERDADPWHWRPLDGENYDDMCERTAPLVERLRTAAADRVLVISHGTVLRPILKQLLDLDVPTTLAIKSPNHLAYRIVLDSPPAVSHYVGARWHPGLRFEPLDPAPPRA